MSEAEAENYAINPFDLTKAWSHADYPLIEVGVMELNRNPVNHFAEVEQATFGPGNLPPGLGASPDKMTGFSDTAAITASLCTVHMLCTSGITYTSCML